MPACVDGEGSSALQHVFLRLVCLSSSVLFLMSSLACPHWSLLARQVSCHLTTLRDPISRLIPSLYASAIPVVREMAEAFAVVGFAAALLQFVDFGTKVIRRLHELENQSADNASLFRGIYHRLPLTLDLVKKIMLQMEAGLIGDKTKEAMYPVIQSCIAQAEGLNKLLQKVLPGQGDNSWIRGKKAIYSVLSESEIERIDAGLKSNFELLIQAGTFQAINRQESSQTISFAPVFAPTFALSPAIQLALAQQEHSPATAPTVPWQESDQKGPPAQTVFMVPFSRDSNFLGRQDVLQAISDAFDESQFVTLAGLGGIG